MARDRDVRNAIVAALEATNAFDAIYTTGLPNFDDQSAEDILAVSIQPIDWNERDEFDDAPSAYMQIESRLRLVFVARTADPQARDDSAEDLLDFARDALNGQVLAGITLPTWTKFSSGKWEDPTPPERKITAVFTYRYLVPTWADFDTTP
jgi:hypothetical protein